jgi:hypothetical protein
MGISICLVTLKLLSERGAQPIFYLCVGKIMRLAKIIVKVAGFASQDEAWKKPVECRDTKFINEKNVSCHDILNYLQCGQPNVLILSRIIVNGPAV